MREPRRMGNDLPPVNLEDIKDYAIFQVDPQGRIVSWNAGAERVKGYTAKEAIGQPFAILFTPEDQRAGRPQQEMQWALEHGVYQSEGMRVRKGGEHFAAAVTLRALSDERGIHRGFVKITQDISTRRRVEAELSQRAEFEQQLIGVVSHDLRTPLSAISLATAMLLRSPDLSTKHVATLGRILSSAERAQRLISNLLDFTQARVGGGFVLQYAPLDLRDFASLVMEETRLAHPGRELLLEPGADIHGEWDPDRLAQLLTNLLSNALLHGLEEAPVRVSVSGDSHSGVLSIHNQGPPIPPDALPHLFEPMKRGPPSERSKKTKSIGLGLYIVQQVVLAHGGSIDVTSSEAEGTTFSVRLPRHPPGHP